ncbi:hypothetical protein [Lachnotalea sp. AF33-28]|nr:hypothetical protein [Lachnotalea sp. AF33-28]
MCAQVINLAVGDSCCALHGARARPYEEYSRSYHARDVYDNRER